MGLDKKSLEPGLFKTALRILFFSIVMSADNSSKLNFMPTRVLAFYAHNNFCLSRVNSTHTCTYFPWFKIGSKPYFDLAFDCNVCYTIRLNRCCIWYVQTVHVLFWSPLYVWPPNMLSQSHSHHSVVNLRIYAILELEL